MFHYSNISFFGSSVSFGVNFTWKIPVSFLSESSFHVSKGANGAAGVLFFNALISSISASVTDLVEEIPGILVFQGIIQLYM